LAAFRRTTPAPAPSTLPSGPMRGMRRAPATRRTRGMPFDKYINPSEVIWVTSKRAARALYEKRTPGPEAALTMRRLVRLRTIHSNSLRGTSMDDFLYNVFFRIHLKKSSGLPPGRPDALRKPTVFSDGFDDVYGAYWSKPRADGWGRTITLCAGDGLDG